MLWKIALDPGRSLWNSTGNVSFYEGSQTIKR